MQTFKVTVFIVIDDTNINAPDLQNCIEYVRDTLATPDNDHFGIKKIEVTGEEVENFDAN